MDIHAVPSQKDPSGFAIVIRVAGSDLADLESVALRDLAQQRIDSWRRNEATYPRTIAEFFRDASR